ncbi:MAG: hypothetical protein HYY65_12170 [Candidatus Tectomicrobia bacterium]|uniref:Transposase n=1 Tax=Tectimicrobiota bacterium TaxID=2528274 RepID=A0A932GRY3_UNCTE|nr:hypothetical protein [Candidatus Tectomicrobia bacterium]
MAYREMGMVEIREVVRRWMGSQGNRAIARATGIDRKTVAKYVRAAQTLGLCRGGLAATDEQIAAVRQAVLSAPERPPSPESQTLEPYREQIRAWLSQDGLRLTKISRRLRALGVTVSYSTLYRFARAHCDFGNPAITVRVAEPPPGEAAEADFGVLGMCGRKRGQACVIAF